MAEKSAALIPEFKEPVRTIKKEEDLELWKASQVSCLRLIYT